ncbi:MAG: hypothetical protein LBK58_03320 [Prevotellaceae bacterium]|jgi:hypothetical protein|nr:hypothetical protein [Prevotellaceae bacterium]
MEKETAIDYRQLIENKINELRGNTINSKITNQEVYLGVDSLNKTDMQQIVTKHLFFLYFSYQTCSPCIQQTVEYIEEVFPDYENDDRIIFISPDYPARFRRNCYGKKLLTLSKGELGIPLESEHVPFIFILNKNMEIEELHIVNKENFVKTLEFLKKLNQGLP